MQKRIFNFMLPDNIREAAREAAKKENRTLSSFFIQAVVEKIEKSKKS